MTSSSAIREIVEKWSSPIEIGEYTIVPTFSMYPSNSLVQVYISGGENRFVVSDGGGAIKILSEAGAIGNAGAQKMLGNMARGSDVEINREGWAYISKVPLAELTSAISVVAEFSREASIILLRHFNPTPFVDFRQEVHAALEQKFHRSLKYHARLIGASNKWHRFDYLIRLNDNERIAIDAVVPDASSINSAVVSHMDVRAANRGDLKQFIVYDDHQNWKSADLSLLDLGAPAIAFSSFDRAMERFVA